MMVLVSVPVAKFLGTSVQVLSATHAGGQRYHAERPAHLSVSGASAFSVQAITC